MSLKKYLLLFVIIILYSSSYAKLSLYQAPDMYSIDLDDIMIIYEKQFETKAELIATFIKNFKIRKKNSTDKKYIIIDSTVMPNSLKYDLKKIIQKFAHNDKKNKSTIEEDGTINISFNSSNIGLDLINVAYGFTQKKILKQVKKYSYPDWFSDSVDREVYDVLLESYQRSFLISAYDDYRDFVLHGNHINYEQLNNYSFTHKKPLLLYYGFLAQKYFLENYGSDKWLDIVNDIDDFKYIFFPYTRTFHDNTGVTLEEFFYETNNYYRGKFKLENRLNQPDLSKVVSPYVDNKFNRQYKSPHKLKDGSIICIYESYNEPMQIVKLNNDKTKEYIAGISGSNDFISVNEPFIIWTERYSSIDFNKSLKNRIVCYDVISKKREIVNIPGFYNQPKLSPKKDKIIAISYDENYIPKLVIIDFKKGKIIQEIENNSNYQYQSIAWYSNNEVVCVVENLLGESSIRYYSLADNKERMLSPISKDLIKDIEVYNKKIYFSYPINNVYNICSMTLDNNDLTQITYSDISAKNPQIYNQKLLYDVSRYWGNEIRELDLGLMKNNDYVYWNYSYDFSEICEQISTLSKSKNAFRKEKLSRFYKLINFGRLKLKYDQKEARLFIESFNPQQTVKIVPEIKYNFNSSGVKSAVTTSFSKIYPNILLNIYHKNANASENNVEEYSLGGGIFFPYQYYHGEYYGRTRIDFGMYHIKNYRSKKILNFLDDNDASYNLFNAKFKFELYKNKARNNFFSPFGQVYEYSFNKLTYHSETQNYIGIKYSLPGFRDVDNILITHGDIWEKTNKAYQFDKPINFAYGYYDVINPDFYSRTTLKYYFPLSYPEIGGYGIAYLARVYGSVFADYSFGIYDNDYMNIFGVSYGKKKKREFNSVGCEVMLDYQIAEHLKLSLGIRYSYLFNMIKNSAAIEFFIPIINF